LGIKTSPGVPSWAGFKKKVGLTDRGVGKKKGFKNIGSNSITFHGSKTRKLLKFRGFFLGARD